MEAIKPVHLATIAQGNVLKTQTADAASIAAQFYFKHA
jgi:hypothetical protein